MKPQTPKQVGAGTEASRVLVARPRSEPSAEPILVEIAWEVCNQIGGIYTVLRSKAPSMVERWEDRYCLIGPHDPRKAAVEFEPSEPSGPMGEAVERMREKGIEAHHGHWMVSGRPRVVLLNFLSVFSRLHEAKYRIWKDHGISLPADDAMLNNVVAFGEVCRELLWQLSRAAAPSRQVVAHFHEWMAGAAVPVLRGGGWPGAIVFTTHASLLGRYLAMNDDRFYEHLSSYDAAGEAVRYRVEAQAGLERAAAHGAHVFTTVSDVTAAECRSLLGRQPELVLPNGLNLQRFTAPHEFQNLHRQYKEKLHEFTVGHFFPSYSFDLKNTIYFFTSGRFEYRNKGMDVTIDALAKLNHRLRVEGTDKTIVAFIITQRPVRSILVSALQSRAMLDEFRTAAQTIGDDLGEKLFLSAAQGEVPDLNSLVEDYWLLRLRRAIQTWKSDVPPAIVTHELCDSEHDAVLRQLRACGLWNQQPDPVKVIYHPDFITPSNPLFRLEYEQFVRGCHLGIFPSYYEPWGYTPLESIALGVPAITSDLSGFGSYLRQILPKHEEFGLYVLPRRDRPFHEAAGLLADRMHQFTLMNSRQRINLRNRIEGISEHFDWHNMGAYYHEAHELALDRVG